jgi:Leucine-rich repeat (LRR) protein
MTVDLNAITTLHNQIQTCIIQYVRLKPNLNNKSNPIYTLTKLQHLELIGCGIIELNATISNLASLQTLLLDWNSELNRLPSSMTKLTSLRHLSLKSTKIQSDTLISVACKLPSLQVLELYRTKQLETIPSQISQLTSLQHLSLEQSRITSLPTQIGLLTQLHTLNLYWCDSLNNIPTELEYLTNLRVFRLNGTTKINRFPLKMKNWTKLEVLELNSLNIETIPSEVLMMTKLRHLSLSHNKLSFITSRLYCLSNLTYLDLSSNQITHISNQINKLTQLQFLYLSSNQLTHFMHDLRNFNDLYSLYLDNNKLTQIPTKLPSRLRSLNIGKNFLTSLHFNTPFSLYNVETLDISDNRIHTLVPNIGHLCSLSWFYASNNNFSFIPSDLVCSHHSKTLFVIISFSCFLLLFSNSCFVNILEFAFRNVEFEFVK